MLSYFLLSFKVVLTDLSMLGSFLVGYGSWTLLATESEEPLRADLVLMIYCILVFSSYLTLTLRVGGDLVLAWVFWLF